MCARAAYRDGNPDVSRSIVDIEDLVQLAKSDFEPRFCPFYW